MIAHWRQRRVELLCQLNAGHFIHLDIEDGDVRRIAVHMHRLQKPLAANQTAAAAAACPFPWRAQTAQAVPGTAVRRHRSQCCASEAPFRIRLAVNRPFSA